MEERLFEIWSEGYYEALDWGGKHPAMYWARVYATSFKEACVKYADVNPAFGEYFKEDSLTWWACRLFDNEVDARKFVG